LIDNLKLQLKNKEITQDQFNEQKKEQINKRGAQVLRMKKSNVIKPIEIELMHEK
jgi:hypothetical protein